MGLIITPNEKTIKVHGTPIELDSVYVRIGFTASPDGKTIDVVFDTYYERTAFDNDDDLLTNIHKSTFSVAIESTETQSIDTALTYSVIKFEEWGYGATIEPSI